MSWSFSANIITICRIEIEKNEFKYKEFLTPAASFLEQPVVVSFIAIQHHPWFLMTIKFPIFAIYRLPKILPMFLGMALIPIGYQ